MLEDALNKLDRPKDITNMIGNGRRDKKQSTQRQKRLESIAEG